MAVKNAYAYAQSLGNVVHFTNVACKRPCTFTRLAFQAAADCQVVPYNI